MTVDALLWYNCPTEIKRRGFAESQAPDPMHIVIPQRLTMVHGVRGGMETQAQTLAEGLVARGHDLVVLTNPHPERHTSGNEGSNRGIPVRYIGPGTWRKYTPAWWNACYHEVAQMHQSHPFDVLLSQSAGALGYIPRVAADLRLPTVVLIHGSMTSELRTRWRGLWSPRGVYRMVRHLKRLPWLLLLWRKAAPMVDRWVVVSHEIAHEWQHELGLPTERITVVPNGIDTARFCPDPAARQVVRQRLDIPPDAPLLLSVGRLEQEKGAHIAIQAVKMLLPRFPALRLLIAGEGSYRAALEPLVAQTNGAVSLLGYVPNQRVPELLAASDIFLMPSLCHEAFPLTIVEALAVGLPVVASRVGGIPTAIEDGRNGLLVPMGSARALAQAVERLLKDEALRGSMAEAALQSARQRFSIGHMVDATEQVLLAVIEQHRRNRERSTTL